MSEQRGWTSSTLGCAVEKIRLTTVTTPEYSARYVVGVAVSCGRLQYLLDKASALLNIRAS